LLPKDALRDILSQELSNTDKLLVCLAVDGQAPKAVREVRELAMDAGLRAVKKWNISSLLARSAALAVRTKGGWELTAQGLEHVARTAGPLMSSPIPKVASALRAHLSKISKRDSVNFVEESIICFEARQYRAAVVLSWVGAVSVLYDHVVANDLSGFNSEATSRASKMKFPWIPAKNADGLARMKESEFLVILEKRSIIGKSVRGQLEKCLDLRNGCGHPNSLKIADHVVASHVEILILNVFSRF